MAKVNSPIIALYYSLKSILFSNQVIYHNLLFLFIRDGEEKFFKKLNKNIDSVLNIDHVMSNKDHESFMAFSETKDFYNILTNSNGDSESFPSIRSNDVTDVTARSDVSQTLNKEGESAIPLFWRTTYFLSEKTIVYKSCLGKL